MLLSFFCENFCFMQEYVITCVKGKVRLKLIKIGLQGKKESVIISLSINLRFFSQKYNVDF